MQESDTCGAFAKVVAILSCCAIALASPLASQTVKVVNMIPFANSDETKQNSEPSLGLHPGAEKVIVASVHAPDKRFCPTTRAAAFLSRDDGDSWDLVCILPKSDLGFPTDATVRFSGDGLALYSSVLRFLVTMQSASISGQEKPSGVTPSAWFDQIADGLTVPNLLTELSDADQPQLVPAPTAFAGFSDPVPKGTVVGARVNSMSATCPAKGVVAASENPFAGPATAKSCISVRGDRLTPAIRLAAHADGTVYAVFYRFVFPSWDHVDVVVVRHDPDRRSANTFRGLTDTTQDASPTDAETMEPPFCGQRDGRVGYRLVRCALYPDDKPAVFGQERRIHSQLAIAVDPTDSKKVHVAWGDSVRGSDSHLTLHFASSIDGGAIWTESDFTVKNGTNPALAVADDGALGMMFQKLTMVGSEERWQTSLRVVQPGAPIQEFVLAEGPSASPARASGMGTYLGDYIELKAKGKDFYGVFSATNDRSVATFPYGAIFQRKYNAALKPTKKKGGLIAVSIDPYFVKVTRP